jgi:signal transduction histidine kinase
MAAIGILDGLTSWETSLFVFYAIPIFIVTWHSGRKNGILLAVTSSAIWFLANWTSHPYQTFHGYAWASLNRGLYFIFVAIGGAAIRQQQEQGRAALEAMKHARTLERQLTFLAEQEQVRIGRDLHDGVCQSLAAIDCATECLRADLAGENLAQTSLAGSIQKMVRETLNEARGLARGLFPAKLEQQGLRIALQELIQTMTALHKTEIHIDILGDPCWLPTESAIHIYRITQECLSNALRHSAAHHIDITLLFENSSWILRIEDDGIGIVQNRQIQEGIGLPSMRHRAEILGAQMEIRSRPGGGTMIHFYPSQSHIPS